MSTGIANTQLLDLLQTTTAHYPWDGKFAALFETRSFPGINEFLSRRHETVEGGTTYDWRVKYKRGGQASAVEINDTIDPSVVNVLATASVPWRQYNTHWTVNRREMLRNKGRAKLIELVKVRRFDAMEDLAELLEGHLWANLPSANTTFVWPVPYWLPQATSTTHTTGWVGQNPVDSGGTSLSDCAGIDASSATYDLWRSYQSIWGADGANGSAPSFTAGDLAKIRAMFRALKFEAPFMVKDNSPARALRYYANDTTIGAFETIADSRNDNIGFDIAKVAENIAIKGVPVSYVAKLDTDTTNPLYAINHNFFRCLVLKGDYLRESEPMNDVTQHNTFTTHVDLTVQTQMKDRRRGGGVICRPA